MNAVDTMVLHAEVERNLREVAEGFATLRAALLPDHEPTEAERQQRAFFEAIQGMQNITDPQRLAQMAYSPFNPMNSYNACHCAGQSDYGWAGGGLGAIFGPRYPYPA